MLLKYPFLSAEFNSAEARRRNSSVFGRDGVIRTLDPHNPIVVRYQAAPRPVQAVEHNAIRQELGRNRMIVPGN